jgi:cyclophilin family peptidyl-prolyl cis-trans isomerase
MKRLTYAAVVAFCLVSVSGCSMLFSSANSNDGGSNMNFFPTSCSHHKLSGPGKRGEQYKHPPTWRLNPKCKYTAILSTSLGSMTMLLDPKPAPLADANFVFLAMHHFYTHILIHRVVHDFMVQTGDPTGTGSGGPGYEFKIENAGYRMPLGTVAMANAGGTATNGSQFFLCENCTNLASPNAQAQGYVYTLLGHITSGISVLNKLDSVPVHAAYAGGEDSTPNTPIYLNSVDVFVSP